MATAPNTDLQQEYRNTTRELAGLNRELASQMISLASQTGDTDPLVHAIEALRAADELYQGETSLRENAEVRQALADTLLTLGRVKSNSVILENAITAYRDAITIASLLGDQNLRRTLKRNYGHARALLSEIGQPSQIRGAA